MSRAAIKGVNNFDPRGSVVQSVLTRISCHCEDASEVFLAATFNGWNSKAMPMTQDTGGDWIAEIELTPGSYEYKFLIDGEWRCEPSGNENVAHEDCVPNPFGTMNRRLEVS